MSDVTHLINPDALGLLPRRPWNAKVGLGGHLRIQQHLFGGAVALDILYQEDEGWNIGTYAVSDKDIYSDNTANSKLVKDCVHWVLRDTFAAMSEQEFRDDLRQQISKDNEWPASSITIPALFTTTGEDEKVEV